MLAIRIHATVSQKRPQIREANSRHGRQRHTCPACGANRYKKNGHARHGKQHHQCKACGRQFTADALDRGIASANPATTSWLFRAFGDSIKSNTMRSSYTLRWRGHVLPSRDSLPGVDDVGPDGTATTGRAIAQASTHLRNTTPHVPHASGATRGYAAATRACDGARG